MKAVGAIVRFFFFVLLLLEAGCEQGPVEPPSPTDSTYNLLSAYTPYTAAKINIMPLTEFIHISGVEQASKIKVYVSLFDSFDCQIKSPGSFRFELYEYVQRSPEPKGRRISMWPDFDLTGSAENNSYWRDYLRAYEFNLDFKPQINQSYILQVTYLCANGKRLSDDFVLKYTK